MGKAFLFRESETNQDYLSTFPLNQTVDYIIIDSLSTISYRHIERTNLYLIAFNSAKTFPNT